VAWLCGASLDPSAGWPPADRAEWSARDCVRRPETVFDGSRPHPGCSELFFDRL